MILLETIGYVFVSVLLLGYFVVLLNLTFVTLSYEAREGALYFSGGAM